MGWLRFALAFCVASFHFASPLGFPLLDGGAAVRCFFVLSGFAIALVLDEKYSGRLIDFYRARARRIYPVYFLVLLLTLLWWYCLATSYQVVDPGLRVWIEHVPTWPQTLLLLASQLSLSGLDWQALWQVQPGLPMERYVALPHAWTLSVELSFYLIAPWLVRLPLRLLLLLAVAGLVFRALAPVDPGRGLANLSFTELGFFCLGIVSYRLSNPLPKSKLLLVGLVLLLLALPSLAGPALQAVVAALAVAIALPSLRQLSGTSQLDRNVGDLSYSLYLVHPLVGWVAAPFFGGGYLALSVAAALLLWWWVDLPLRQAQRNA